MKTSRRAFLNSTVSAFALGGLRRYIHASSREGAESGYGLLKSDPQRILDLSANFTYQVISGTGETMSDGLLVPGAHDGMAAFAGPQGRTILVRNHELSAGDETMGAFGARNELLEKF